MGALRFWGRLGGKAVSGALPGKLRRRRGAGNWGAPHPVRIQSPRRAGSHPGAPDTRQPPRPPRLYLQGPPGARGLRGGASSGSAPAGLRVALPAALAAAGVGGRGGGRPGRGRGAAGRGLHPLFPQPRPRPAPRLARAPSGPRRPPPAPRPLLRPHSRPAHCAQGPAPSRARGAQTALGRGRGGLSAGKGRPQKAPCKG